MSACAVIPIRPTLYTLEEDLAALLECVETVEPQQEAEFLTALGVALAGAKDKRDQVAHWMSHLENQIAFSKCEIQRLKDRRTSFELQLDRIKAYVVRVMDANGTKRLEGDTVTLALRKCPASVEIADEAQVPMKYRRASLALPWPLLDEILDALPEGIAQDVLGLAHEEDMTIDKRALKAALEDNHEIPGARIAPVKYTVVRL